MKLLDSRFIWLAKSEGGSLRNTTGQFFRQLNCHGAEEKCVAVANMEWDRVIGMKESGISMRDTVRPHLALIPRLIAA